MNDAITAHLGQLAGLIAGVLALTEMLPLPVGVPGKTRKRWTALLYAVAGAVVAYAAGFLQMPYEGWRGYLGAVLLALLAVGGAHLAVVAKKKVTGTTKAAS